MSSEKCFFIICQHWLWFKLLKTFHRDKIGQISVQKKNVKITYKGTYFIAQFRNKVCKQDRQGAHEHLCIYFKRKKKSLCSRWNSTHTWLPAGSYSIKGRASADTVSIYFLQKTYNLMGELSEQSMQMITEGNQVGQAWFTLSESLLTTLISNNEWEHVLQLWYSSNNFS